MGKNSYRAIFEASAIVGGAQVTTVLLGIIRTKALALMLGPAGMGLVGLYATAADLIGTLCSMGIGSSGVRTVAEAAAIEDNAKIGRTIITLRRVSLVTGIIGMLVLLTISSPLSRLTFGNDQHTCGMALMSLTLLFRAIGAGQTALLQGLRKIRELASSRVFAAVLGTIAGIALIHFLREDGVAPYLVTVSLFGIITSWWYARRIHVAHEPISFRDTFRESRALLGMGFAFMVSAMLTAGVAYASRIVILWQLRAEAVGLYQATWTLSSLYVSVVLNAMAMDFYPRLTAVAKDNMMVNRMVNEQAEMGLLMTTPGVLATITFAPWVLAVFYSGEFIEAAEIIQWQIMGIALRVVSWPLGFVIIAKGNAKIFLLCETTSSALNISLLFLCLSFFGLEGIGISFVLLYVIHSISMYSICRWLTGFMWSVQVRNILIWSCMIIGLTFIVLRGLPQSFGVIAGILLTIGTTYACLQRLQKILNASIITLLKRSLANK